MGLEAFEAAGHYDPASPKAAERAELLEHLVERFGEEAVLEQAARVPLFSVAVELTHPEGPRVSARELAARAGLEVEDVVLLRAAVGQPVTDVDEPSIPVSLVDIARAFAEASRLFGRDATLAFVRVMGRVSQQVASAAGMLFASTVVEEGGGPGAARELAVSRMNEVSWAAYQAIPRVLEHILLDRSTLRLDYVGHMVQGDLRQAIGFVDLVGSTEWAVRVDPQRHAAALVRFEAAAWEAAVARGGRLVKLIGDEAMVVADRPEVGCAIAWDLCRCAAADPDLPEARAGVAYGEVTAWGGDFFGPIVSLAARLRGEASPGQLVTTAAVAQALASDTWSSTGLGPATLRGIPGPVELFDVRPRV